MPRFAPDVKVRQTEGHGATVILHGETFDDAVAHAHIVEAERGLLYVPPYDDALIMAGQGTVALEMLEDVPALDTLVVPIGGGGLISGMATAAKAIDPRDQGRSASRPSCTRRCGRRTRGQTARCDGETLAEGIAVKTPGELTFRVVEALVDDILLVGERDLERAVSLLLTIEKTVVEGAGAAGLAAVLANPAAFRGRTVGLVLCGGNIDTRLLANVLLRDLARSGRLARLRIRLKDRPGQLFEVMRVFDRLQVNILEIYHQRVFTTLPAKGLITEIECETRDRDHLDRLVEALRAGGYDVRPVELD